MRSRDALCGAVACGGMGVLGGWRVGPVCRTATRVFQVAWGDCCVVWCGVGFHCGVRLLSVQTARPCTAGITGRGVEGSYVAAAGTTACRVHEVHRRFVPVCGMWRGFLLKLRSTGKLCVPLSLHVHRCHPWHLCLAPSAMARGCGGCFYSERSRSASSRCARPPGLLQFHHMVR